jgi:hypothetical protein
MEPEGALPRTQQAATCPHSEPKKSHPQLPIVLI